MHSLSRGNFNLITLMEDLRDKYRRQGKLVLKARGKSA